MKRFALLGQPLSHSLSPALHKAIYRQLEIDDASYRTVELSDDKLGIFFQGFRAGGFDGVNITIPHKSTVISLLDEVDKKAKLINAVNCIHRQRNKLVGYNTDMLGFAHSLRNNNMHTEGGAFLLLGSGGSALAVAAVLAEGDAASVAIYNRTEERAKRVGEVVAALNPDVKVRILGYDDVCASKEAYNCVINTTSVGMSPATDESPLDLSQLTLANSALVFDLIYNPSQTALLKQAQELSLATANGLEMLVAQAVYSVEIWMGGNVVAHIDMGCLVKELEKLLVAKKG